MKLEDINKEKQIFKVPDQYFEELPERIKNRIHTSEKIKHFSPRWKYALASFLLLLLVGIFFYLDNEPTYEEYLCEASNEQLMEYLYLNDISSYQIDQVLDVSEDVYEEIISDQMDFNEKMIEEELYFENIEILTEEIQ